MTTQNRVHPTPAEAADIGARLGLLTAVVLLLGDIGSDLVRGVVFLPSIGRSRWILERIFLFDLTVMGGVAFAEIAAAIRRWRPRLLRPNGARGDR